MAEAQGNRRFLSLVLEALCLKLEVSKLAQEENPSWFSSQESKEGADPENIPGTEDFLSTSPQLLLLPPLFCTYSVTPLLPYTLFSSVLLPCF